VPSVEALSTTTVATGTWVWPRSAASASASRARRFQVTTTATTRVGSAVEEGTQEPYGSAVDGSSTVVAG